MTRRSTNAPWPPTAQERLPSARRRPGPFKSGLTAGAALLVGALVFDAILRVGFGEAPGARAATGASPGLSVDALCMSLGLWAVHAARPWRGPSKAGPRGEGARPAPSDIAPDDTCVGFCTVLAVIPLYGLVLGRAVAPDTAPGARVPDAILCVELCYLTMLMTTQWFFLALREVGVVGPDCAPNGAKTEAPGEEGPSCRS